MSNNTPYLGLLKKDPSTDGNDTFNIETMINEPYDEIDADAAKPFYLTAAYDSANDRITCTFGPGIAELFNGNAQVIVKLDANTTYYIASPAINTTYYLFLQQDGTFIANTTGIVPAGAVLLWQVATGATKDVLTITDRRFRISGAGTALAAHKAETVTQLTLITEPFDQITTTTVNLGFCPKLVNIQASITLTNYLSNGFNTDGGYCTYIQVASNKWDSCGPAIMFKYDESNYMYGAVATTPTGIIITWTKIGTLTGASGNRKLVISAMTH